VAIAPEKPLPSRKQPLNQYKPMSKHHLLFIVAGVAVGYFACNSLNQYNPWKFAYAKGAGAA
jgi:hypothetical protein